MWRYVGVCIIIGLVVSTGVFFLYEMGIFVGPAKALWDFYESSTLTSAAAAEGPIDLLQFGVFTGLALGIAWCVIDIPRAHLNAIVVFSSLFLIMGLSFTLALYGIYFEPFSGASAIVSSAVLGMVYARTQQGQRKPTLFPVRRAGCAPLRESSRLPSARAIPQSSPRFAVPPRATVSDLR